MIVLVDALTSFVSLIYVIHVTSLWSYDFHVALKQGTVLALDTANFIKEFKSF
jgi:hypothetical protein